MGLPEFSRKRSTSLQDRLGDLVLGGDRHLGLGSLADQGDGVALALEADLGIGDVVEDDQVGALARELPRARSTAAPAAVLGGEADDRLALRAPGG